MRWTAKSAIARSLLIVAFGSAVALACVFRPAGIARAGAITDVGSPAAQRDDTFDLDQDPSGPAIRFNLSPSSEGPGNLPSDPAGSQETYAPWIVQDRNSLDWFGKRDDLLSIGASDSSGAVSQSPVALDTPPVRDPLTVDDETQRFEPSEPNPLSQESLGHTATKILVGFLQGFGYAKTWFVLIPIAILVFYIALSQITKLLRASQGLDPVKGEHRWGIRRSGRFGPVEESNDNLKPKRRERDVA